MGFFDKIFNKEENNKEDNKKMKDGEFVSHWGNGEIKEKGNYKDGKLDGNYTCYYENRQIWYETNYKDGKEDGKVTFYYENGQIKEEKNHKDGKLEGKITRYHYNGHIDYVENYKDGKRLKFSRYHKNGQIKDEVNFKDGEKYGEQTFYNEDGTQIKIIDDKKITYYYSIIKLLKERGEKMATSDIDAFLKSLDIDGIKEQCELMYHNGDINRTSNYRYFILSEEKKKKKPAKVEKSEEIDVKSELKKYKDMLDEGLITQEQYDTKSNELLGI